MRVAPYVAHGAESDDRLRTGGYPLVRGQRLVFSSYVVQRDPRFFEEPERFLPERWLDERLVKSVPKYAYFPFNGGQESAWECILP